MTDLAWEAGEEDKAIAGLKAVRNDGDDTDWAFITYAGNKGAASQKFVFGGQGSGGVDALKANFKEDNIAFALVRVTDKIDLSVTVKFCWIKWVAKKAPRMMVSRLSVQLGALQSFFEPFSTDLTCNLPEEVSQSILMEKVMAYSVSGSKVIDEKTGQAGYRAVASGGAGSGTVKAWSGRMADGPVDFADGLAAELADVRNDDTDTNWVLATYEDPNAPKIVLLAKGSGGIPEMRGHLNPQNVAYGLVRKNEKIDDSIAVKFAYIRWVGDKIPVMQKAKLGTHAGDVNAFFSPTHTSLDAPDLDEINDENIMRLIQIASGTYVHVLSDDDSRSMAHKSPAHSADSPSSPSTSESAPARVQKPKPAPVAGGSHGGTVRTLEGAVNIDDAIAPAIQSVRDDSNLIDWVLVGYDYGGKNTSKNLVLVGTGEGGLSEMKSQMKPELVLYGLYRTTERIDDSETVKFVFIDWRGAKIHRMQRAQLGTHSGAVRELFEPYHVDVLDASADDEVTEEIIKAKISKAAGTANYVK